MIVDVICTYLMIGVFCTLILINGIIKKTHKEAYSASKEVGLILLSIVISPVLFVVVLAEFIFLGKDKSGNE